jgi:hypothetical protein
MGERRSEFIGSVVFTARQNGLDDRRLAKICGWDTRRYTFAADVFSRRTRMRPAR